MFKSGCYMPLFLGLLMGTICATQAQAQTKAPRVADAAWFAATAANFAATGIDYGIAYHYAGLGHGYEAGIISRHSLAAGLGFSLGVNAVTTVLSYKWKREDMERRAVGVKPNFWRWWTLPAVNIAPHAVAISISLGHGR